MTKKPPFNSMSKPVYIAFEGGEGSGKSTQASLLAKRIGALVTREPGGTELGQALRHLLLNPGEAPIGARAETLMMAADRAQHLDDVVLPALKSGRSVVSDRSAYSSLAYQGGGRELGVESVRVVNDWALDGRWPQLVVLLDCDLQTSRARLGKSLDRLEQEGVDFHRRVRQTYLMLADAVSDDDNPTSWVTVSSNGAIDEVEAAVWAEIGDRVTGE